MSLLIIPIQEGVPSWRQRTPLDGTDYLLDFFWNDRAKAWYLSVLTVDGDPIICGKKIVCSMPTFKRKRYDDRLPPGEIVCIDWNDKIDVPQFDDLNRSATLYYFDQEEITSL